MTEITVKKGDHHSWPIQIREGKNIDWCYEYSLKGCKYDLGDSLQQFDLNKLTGVKTDYFSPTNNSIMVAFRYNIRKDNFELFYYWHDAEMIPIVLNDRNYDVWVVENEAAAHIAKATETDDRLFIRMVSEGNEVTFYLNETVMRWRLPAKQLYLINFWFGGQLPAPNDVSVLHVKTK